MVRYRDPVNGRYASFDANSIVTTPMFEGGEINANVQNMVNAANIQIEVEMDALFNSLWLKFSDAANNEFTKKYVELRAKLQELVPVRSGKLLDYILTNMAIIVKIPFPKLESYPEIDVTIVIGYPSDRPFGIRNPAHIMKREYGERYIPFNHINNRTFLQNAGIKSAIYLLNDPKALPDVVVTIHKIKDKLMQELADILADKWQDLITLTISTGMESYLSFGAKI